MHTRWMAHIFGDSPLPPREHRDGALSQGPPGSLSLFCWQVRIFYQSKTRIYKCMAYLTHLAFSASLMYIRGRELLSESAIFPIFILTHPQPTTKNINCYLNFFWKSWKKIFHDFPVTFFLQWNEFFVFWKCWNINHERIFIKSKLIDNNISQWGKMKKTKIASTEATPTTTTTRVIHFDPSSCKSCCISFQRDVLVVIRSISWCVCVCGNARLREILYFGLLRMRK